MLLYVTEISQNTSCVFAVRQENANMVLIRKQTNVDMDFLHAIPINENNEVVSLGREILGCVF